MTSITGAPLTSSTELSKQIALLPTITGLLTVVVTIVGAGIAGVNQSDAARVLVWLGAGLILVGLMAGVIVGHYLGLVMIVIASLMPAADTTDPLAGSEAGSRSLTQLVLVALWILLVHEIGRFSLDARLPNRFGPGVVRRYVLNAVAVGAAVGAVAVATRVVSDWSLPPILLPVGLALAALPLFTRRWVQGLPKSQRSSALIRLTIGVLAVVVTLGAVVLGAQARSAIINDRTPPLAQPSSDLDQSDEDQSGQENPEPLETAPPSVTGQVVTIGLLVAAIIIAGLVYAAFRRPEEPYELDDLLIDVDSRTVGLARPGQADLDDHQGLVDDRQMAELLDELVLDLSAEPDPGRAVRFGYATIERRLHHLGVERGEAETEQEFLLRVLPVLTDSTPMVELTNLFEHARFSPEPIDEAMRHQALDAVERLRAEVSSQ
ncbi:MAG: DUF4129 domain-containing protein [Actinomycetia bacterium]|nr:DUF4129 domain-containing protein [Actinomycetes bacterium]MCP5032657.1 DUF4129 domain-containing protein [Actinomycetes bacterium]